MEEFFPTLLLDLLVISITFSVILMAFNKNSFFDQKIMANLDFEFNF